MLDATARNVRMKSLVVLVSAAVASIVGVLVMIGWAGDVAVLKSVVPGQATTKLNTALSFVLSGISLYALGAREPGKGLRAAGLAAAWSVLAMSLLTLAQYVFAINLGIDELLVRDQASSASAFPGRMAPVTTVALVLIALTLLFLHLRRFLAVAQATAAVAVLVSAICCLSYLYDVDSLQYVALFSTVALQTAVALLVVSIGLLAALPPAGWIRLLVLDGAGGMLARRLLPAVSLVPVVLGWFVLNGHAAGLYDSAFGIAVLTIAVITLLSVLVLWTAAKVEDAGHQFREAVSDLQASERRLRTALSAGRMGAWSWDLVAHSSVLTGQEFELLGLASADGPVDTELFFERVHPEDIDSLRKSFAQAIEHGPDFEMEFRIVLPDGEIRWLAGAGQVFRDASGAPLEMYGVHFDVTGRKTIEASLRESDERFRSFMEHTPAIVWIDDEDGVNRFANAALAREIGRPVEEIIGKHMSEILGEAAPVSAYLESNRQVHESGQDESAIVSAPRRDGSIGRFLVTKFPMAASAEGRKRLGGVAIDVTERERALEELGASEERFRLLVKSVKDFAIFSLDQNGVIQTWNEAAAHIYGYAASEVIGKHRAILFSAEDAARGLPQRELDVARVAGKLSEEGWRVRKDGSRFWSNGTMSALHDESGNVTGFVKVVRDLTERMQLLSRVQDAQQRLELATKSAALGIWEWNAATGDLTWDERMFQLYGVSAEEFSGTYDSWINCLHPDDRARTEAELVAAIQSMGGFHAEFRVLWSNGEVRHLQAHGLVVHSENGASTRVVGVNWDITNRKVAEASLRLRDKAIQAVSQGILITDPNQADNPIIYASRGFEGMTGYTSLSALGKNCRFLQGTDTDPATVSVMREAIAAGRECSVEILNYKQDGTPFWNALYLTPVLDEAGKLIHFVGVQADVTERRTLERAFHQAQKMEAIGQLTGGIAHDFNNLLTVILGNSELLIEESGESSQRLLLDMISAAARSGSELTHRLLAFARKQVLDPRATDVHSLVRALSGMLHRLIGEQVRLEIRTGAGPGLAFIDAAQLEGALLNLCINARDAMPGGGRLILESSNVQLDSDYIAMHSAVNAGEYVVISVSDSGVGIPADDLERVFEPFFTTKLEGKGTGLGMAMVYGFVKQSGGNVTIYSEPGLGTTVKLYLPATRESVESSADAGPALPLPGGSEHVLLVEDDGLVRSFAAGQLRFLGYQVLEAIDGPGALEILRSEQQVNLLFTDVVMPGMSGSELADEARSLRPGLRVLFTSGYTRDALVTEGRRSAGVRLLNKPYGRAALARQVREALDDTELE